jgi:hypothetical protein
METKTNKIIAEFMDCNYNSQISDICADLYNSGSRSIEIMNGVEPLVPYDHYNNSWEWLMPVVEKIESIKDDHHGYFGVYISSNSCTIQGTNLRLDEPMAELPIYFNSITLNTKFESTFKMVVNFIKWYNKK